MTPRVRDDVGHGDAVPGDHEALAGFHPVEDLGVVVPELPLGNDCRHPRSVARV
jgi:hypothetical protein